MLYKSKSTFKINSEKVYILADFNKTFTKGNSKTTWSIFATSNLFCEEYKKDRNELFNIYKPFEDDEILDYAIKKDKLSEWWKKHIDLFTKYKISEDLFRMALEEENIMELRDGVKEFLEFLNKKNIPLIIVSQGIGNFAKAFLEMNNCYFNNIYITSNMVEFNNNIATGNIGDITHNLNKNEFTIPKHLKNSLDSRNQVVVIGDEINDLNMLKSIQTNQVIKIGILTKKHENDLEKYKDNFDLVLSDIDSYKEILELF